MILVTGIERRGDQDVISGVLLDSLLPGGYTESVFDAFLSSDRIRKIVCEKPQYEGGHGHTRDGLIVSKFTSQLHGVCAYSHKPLSPVGFLTQIVENRIELVTTADLHDCVYPAFLAHEAVPPPVSTQVIVKLESTRFASFPEVQAFAETDSYILKRPSINENVRCGTILPVCCVAPAALVRGALKLLHQLGPSEFEGTIYNERKEGVTFVGSVLTRTIIKQKRDFGEIQFSAKIGTIVRVID